MGELTDGDRGVGRHADPFDDDPFAELARLIDSTEGQRPAVAPAPPLDEPHFDFAADADFDLDMDAFAGALDEELSRDSVTIPPAAIVLPAAEAAAPAPKAAVSYSSWLSPSPRASKAVASPAPSASSVAPVPEATAGDLVSDPVLEAAFRGLSAPANPRDSKYQESEAFAPARKADASASEPTAQLFDDFDALIASELAAMQKPVQAAPVAATPAHVMDDSAAPHGLASDHDEFSPPAPETRQAASAARRQAVSGRRAGLAAASGALPSAARQQPMSRRMMSVGASLLVIALIGGAGAYMLTGEGGTVYDAPLIVQADTEPVKVAPKDPGGRAIPNQNKAVYERVQSADAAIEPSQQTLLTAAEEPAELPQPEPEPVLSDLPGVDLNPIGTALAAEPVRVADAGADSSPIAVLTPRRVRTLTVNPDGTLVATEQVPETSLQDLRGENPALIEAASRPIDSLSTGATAAQASPGSAVEGGPAPGIPMPSMKPGTESAAPVQVAAAPLAESQPAPVVAEAPPTEVPAAVAAPAPEPVATEVAALPAATPPAPADGGYYVQISSQPSREAAEVSSRTLGQRFADVIGGRSLVIQSADIPGKGTYHRVRVAAGLKNEANDLCQRLKSAGGSCFVSR